MCASERVRCCVQAGLARQVFQGAMLLMMTRSVVFSFFCCCGGPHTIALAGMNKQHILLLFFVLRARAIH